MDLYHPDSTTFLAAPSQATHIVSISSLLLNTRAFASPPSGETLIPLTQSWVLSPAHSSTRRKASESRQAEEVITPRLSRPIERLTDRRIVVTCHVHWK